MITVYEWREHLQDREAECNRVRRYRDQAWHIYWAERWNRGRRFRGRMLSRWNQAVCDARRRCIGCTQAVLWEDGTVISRRRR